MGERRAGAVFSRSTLKAGSVVLEQQALRLQQTAACRPSCSRVWPCKPPQPHDVRPHLAPTVQPRQSVKRSEVSLQCEGGSLAVPGFTLESRGGRPGLSVLTSLLVCVDVKIY